MKRGYLYIAVTTLLFSSMEVALKLISGQFNPIQLNFSRFLVGGLVLIPFAVRELKKRGRKLDGKALGSFALLGLMGIAVSMSLYQLSVTRIQASVVGVLFSSNPVFVTLFAFLLLHETISKNQIAGLVLDVAGIVLIIQPWHLRLDALGVVYVLLAPLLAFLVLHEAIPGNMLAGIACILCGSLVSILPGLLAQRRAAALPFAEDTVK